MVGSEENNACDSYARQTHISYPLPFLNPFPTPTIPNRRTVTWDGMTGTRTGFVNLYVFDGYGLEPNLPGITQVT
jgi:hypothetical protein